MRKHRLAEALLSLVGPADRAASAIGDLIEGGGGRGRFWFWRSVMPLWLSLLWRDLRTAPLAMAVSCVAAWFVYMALSLVLAFLGYVAVTLLCLRASVCRERAQSWCDARTQRHATRAYRVAVRDSHAGKLSARVP